MICIYSEWYKHTYLLTYLPAHLHTYLPACLPTYLPYVRTCVHACTYVRTHTYIHIHTYLHTYIHACLKILQLIGCRNWTQANMSRQQSPAAGSLAALCSWPWKMLENIVMCKTWPFGLASDFRCKHITYWCWHIHICIYNLYAINIDIGILNMIWCKICMDVSRLHEHIKAIPFCVNFNPCFIS